MKSTDIVGLGAGAHLPSTPDTFEGLVWSIGETLERARGNAARKVNTELLAAYWGIGRLIVEYEQSGADRAQYGDGTLRRLSRRLSAEYGKGFSRTNLQNMRLLYQTHQNCQTLSGKLTWSHYCTLLDVSDGLKRGFYEREAENAGWSVRELRRQMDSMLFERVLAAKGNPTPQDAVALAQAGIAMDKPADIVLGQRDGTFVQL